MIIWHNKKAVSRDQLEMFKSLSNFVLNKFFRTKAMRDSLEIHIHLQKNYFKETSMYGDCIWEDQHFRPKDFTINVDVSQKDNMILNTIAHELVHVKQWAKGEMYELQSKRKCYKYKGNEYNRDKMDYWDYPWEIEAHGHAIGLVVQWSRTLDLNSKKKDSLLIGV